MVGYGAREGERVAGFAVCRFEPVELGGAAAPGDRPHQAGCEDWRPFGVGGSFPEGAEGVGALVVGERLRAVAAGDVDHPGGVGVAAEAAKAAAHLGFVEGGGFGAHGRGADQVADPVLAGLEDDPGGKQLGSRGAEVDVVVAVVFPARRFEAAEPARLRAQLQQAVRVVVGGGFPAGGVGVARRRVDVAFTVHRRAAWPPHPRAGKCGGRGLVLPEVRGAAADRGGHHRAAVVAAVAVVAAEAEHHLAPVQVQRRALQQRLGVRAGGVHGRA